MAHEPKLGRDASMLDCSISHGFLFDAWKMSKTGGSHHLKASGEIPASKGSALQQEMYVAIFYDLFCPVA